MRVGATDAGVPSAAHPAEWKEYRPRGPKSSGMGGNQEDLVVAPGKRAEMMCGGIDCPQYGVL